MARQILYRNIRARDQLEVFLVSAVSSLLLLRFYLHITGYPQVGGGTLHIAHMLLGGMLMLVAITLSLSFMGARAQRLTALCGGIGFGVFIDEVGKFITRDNDYFFRPTIGIIYAIFAVLYLTFNFLARKQRLSSREYQLNALAQLEEAIAHNMDEAEKAEVGRLLAQANQNSAITKQLQALLEGVHTVPAEPPRPFYRLLAWMDELYRHFWERKNSNRLVRIFFLLVMGLFLVGVLASIYNNVDNVLDLFQGVPTYSHALFIGELVSSLLAAALAMYGVAILRQSHKEGFEQFRRATLVNIFLTEFFIFSREQFGAIPGFVFNLALLIFINLVLHQEYRLKRKAAS